MPARLVARVDAFFTAARRNGIRESGTAIAEAANLPAPTVNAVLRGRAPRTETVLALTRALNTPLETLFEIVE